jgi:hypothetical protein
MSWPRLLDPPPIGQAGPFLLSQTSQVADWQGAWFCARRWSADRTVYLAERLRGEPMTTSLAHGFLSQIAVGLSYPWDHAASGWASKSRNSGDLARLNFLYRS